MPAAIALPYFPSLHTLVQVADTTGRGLFFFCIERSLTLVSDMNVAQTCSKQWLLLTTVPSVNETGWILIKCLSTVALQLKDGYYNTSHWQWKQINFSWSTSSFKPTFYSSSAHHNLFSWLHILVWYVTCWHDSSSPRRKTPICHVTGRLNSWLIHCAFPVPFCRNISLH